jgi:hypothetical protein
MQEEFVDQEQLQTHLNELHCNKYHCHHCRKEFIDKMRLEAHYTETRHPRSPETPDDELPDFEEVKRSSKVCSSCGAEGHDSKACTQKTDCHKCLVSSHFSRKCDECRPRCGCFRCGDPGHAQRGCPVGPAFGAKGEARTAFSKAFARSESSYEKILAAGEVDEKSLGDLDKGLAKKLEFKCSIPLAKLKNRDLGPATKDDRASNERTVRVTLASPPVIWSMKSPKPSKVAVVTPVNVEKGPPLGCRGDSDVRRSSISGHIIERRSFVLSLPIFVNR